MLVEVEREFTSQLYLYAMLARDSVDICDYLISFRNVQ